MTGVVSATQKSARLFHTLPSPSLLFSVSLLLCSTVLLDFHALVLVLMLMIYTSYVIENPRFQVPNTQPQPPIIYIYSLSNTQIVYARSVARL